MKNPVFKIGVIILFLVSIFLTNLVLSLFDAGIGSLISSIFYGDIIPLIIFLSVLIVIFLALTIIAFLGARRIGFGLNNKKEKKLGTSKLAEIKEFKHLTGDDGVLIGKKMRLSANHSYSHILLAGVTGSGKSTSYFIPNLVSIPDASFIVTDPKGELFEKTAMTNLNQGKRVLVFSPFKDDTLKYNPLALCRNETEIRELAQTLLVNGNASIEAATGQKSGGGEWINMSTPLLASFLIYVKMLGAPKDTVSYALNLIIENDLDSLKFMIEDSNPVAEKQFNIFLQSAGSEQTASSIKTVLATNLQMFVDPMIENLTSVNEINPELLRERPTALYVVVPEHRSDFMSPLMAPFYSQMIGRLIEIEGSPVYFFADEFANIGVINGIDKYLATVRSRNMSITLGIQSINQLKQRYGQDTSGTILDNLKTKVILPGSAYETANYFSQLIGNEEISTYSNSDSKGDKSYSESKTRRELFSADEIRRLPDGKMLVVTDNKNPFLDDQNRYYENNQYIELTKKKANIDQYVKWYRSKLT
ncbi:type IV secretory system conjugative DNA transfer family protein [[Brevibacterium] frigoritolerans]|nr:type IV secretory system conjugative DNA transfer family protein [Peribacillus frigoritolerans]